MSMKHGYILRFDSFERLQSLREGKVRLNPISKYRKDKTEYRGDTLEGKFLLDPDSFQLFYDNEHNLFEDGFPRPDCVIAELNNDDNLYIFCAVKLDEAIVCKADCEMYQIKESVKNEMIKFAEYVAIISVDEFEIKLREALKVNAQGLENFVFDKIKYCDKFSFENTSEDKIDYYFTKDIAYENQNEWRLLVFGNFKENSDHSITLDLQPFLNFEIFKASEFFENFRGVINNGN